MTEISSPPFAIGIDTGGTYTDAVVYDTVKDCVLASAKTPTTHQDLAGCIGRALRRVLADSGARSGQIRYVSVSTTLATNAVVEGKGARVGLVLAGYNKPLKLPVVGTVYIAGGHEYSGQEKKPLDLDELLDGVGRLAPDVDAFAVSSLMSFVNPAHELVAAKSIELTARKPVYCSHQVSERAGVGERAATAVLNARLDPVMAEFIAGLERAMADLELKCPVRIVRGDATVMDVSEAMSRAAATFASGPAATSYFGCRFSDADDVVVVDVGGTTTDVIVLQNRAAAIDERGSLIGQWETHVDSLEMSTAGVGGDSLTTITDGGVKTGPLRVTPLAFADKDAPRPGAWIGAEQASRLVLPGPLARKDGSDPVEAMVVEKGGATPGELCAALRMSPVPLRSKLETLAHAQRVTIIGFTPTDALHVLGRMELGDAEMSREGAQALGAILGQDAESFCQTIIHAAETEICNAVIRHVARMEADEFVAGFLSSDREKSLLDVTVRIRLPMAGVGAAARYLLPGVAERLGTKIFFPKWFEVGNAVGAALLARDSGL